MAFLTPRVYRALSLVLLPLAAFYLMYRSRRQPSYRHFWNERFAWGSFPLKSSRPRVWMHTVSVGETNAAKPLIEAMLNRWQDCDIVLTHMTPTGREAGARLVALAPDRISQCYLPYDAPYAVEKFFRQTQPTMGLIMETEVWPNLMQAAKEKGIPVALVNARESEKSQKKALRFIELMRPAFSSFSMILAQSEADKTRLAALGGDPIYVCGSLKFDLTPNESQVALAKAWKREAKRPIVMLASARDGEEKMLLDALQKGNWQDKAQVWIVPRHPQRFDDVAAMLEASGLKWIRRTACDSLPQEVDVVLGDSMGEMSFYCALSDVTLMGGSFGPYGSQNVIEPALAGSAVVVGPSTYNFETIIREGVEADAMVSVSDMTSGFMKAMDLINDPLARETLGHAARAFSERDQGATSRMMGYLETLWNQAQKSAPRDRTP